MENDDTATGGNNAHFEPHIPGLPWIAGLFIFFVYVYTLAPSIIGGDTGELVAVVCATGVAHPPGYPLFSMLAKLFSFIPLSSIAWRVNLLSAVSDSLAAVVILITVRRWTRNQCAGLVAAGLFAFSPVIWANAVVAEVFALNNLLLTIMLYLGLRFSEDRSAKFAYLTSLVFGIGMSNHHTCLFYGIPIMLWILITGRGQLWTIRRLAAIAGCFILGLLPYAYLPLADLRITAISWGNTSSVRGFLTHLMRSEYGTLNLAANKPDSGGYFLRGISEYFRALPYHTLYVGLILALAGLSHAIRREGAKGFTFITLIAFASYVIVFHLLANVPIDQPLYLKIQSRFWQQANLLVCVWAGLGFGAAAVYLRGLKWRRWVEVSIAIVILLLQAAVHFRKADHSSNLVFPTYVRELLRPLPPNAVVWSREDLITFPVYYIQQCEGYRTDVRVLNRELLRLPWMKRLVNANYSEVVIPGRSYGQGVHAYDMKRLLDANEGRFAMFATRLEWDRPPDWSWDKDYELWPFGMVSWILPKRVQVDTHSYVTESEKALPQLDFAALAEYPEGSWENEILKYYWEARLNRANHLIDYANAHGGDRFLLEAGVAGIEDMVQRLRINDPEIFKKLSEAYAKLAVYDSAYRLKADEAWAKYLRGSLGGTQPNNIGK